MIKLYKAETTDVAAAVPIDGLSASTGTDRLHVVVSPASATRLVLRTGTGASSATPTAGASTNLKVTATDPFGNTDTAYTGDQPLTFSDASSSPGPATAPTVTDKTGLPTSFGTPTTITFTSGVATKGGGTPLDMVLYKAETANVAAQASGISASSGADRLTATVSAASASRLVVRTNAGGASATPAAGATTTVKLTATDPYGNT